MDSYADEEKIDVVKIMERVRENIQKRKESSNLGLLDSGLCRKFDRDMNYINSNWHIQNDSYYISSHRRWMGKPLIKGRQLVHSEVRRYIDPILFKQSEYNGSVARILNEIIKMIESVSSRVDHQQDNMLKVQADLDEELNDRIVQFQTELRKDLKNERDQVQEDFRKEIQSEIEDRVRSVVAAMNEEIENRAWLVSILDERANSSYDPASKSSRDDLNYFVFEDRFRGEREYVKGRKNVFVKFFMGCKNVLDIGCGRGEFLELLREHDIGARGVDIDEDMVIYCKSRGFDVEKSDAITYLESIDDKSLDGIFIDQVAEHLEPAYLMRMLKLCGDKLMYGHHIIVQTVNPLSLYSFINFYIDLSHKKPLHPDTMRFLLQFAGFRDIETQFLAPVSEDVKFKRLEVNEEIGEERGWMKIYNQNIEMLNNTLYGAQDYAIVGKK